ncbi:MAG: NAD(P)H-binding protein [Proteobacteria bacterium]|nr:NAD(P)H-binding protein [Pseudomonadota bacterium]
MKVLLTGANGFIGRYLLARLLDAGHQVIPAVRRPAETDRLLPAPASIAVDFNRDIRPGVWAPRLAGVDAVVNCAGILQGRPGQSIGAIHSAAPRALFAACEAIGVRRVIQISAISADPAAGTAYAATKKAADYFLAATGLDWVIMRPSLVYAEGAYGGTALFRALAALPWVIPVIGKGDQPFQPIHIDDLTATVLHLLHDGSIRRMVIEPVGPETVTLKEILVRLRRWLGLPAARLIAIPNRAVRLAARIGDVIGGTINTTALRQLEFGNAAPVEPFTRHTGIRPRSWDSALLARPAQAQDRWHARLYFQRPVLRWLLSAMWIVSGVVGLLQPSVVTAPLMARLGLSGLAADAIMRGACLADIAIGMAVLCAWRPAATACVQLASIALYTLVLSVVQPGLWLDPFGPLLKNLPICAAIMVLAAIEPER